MVSFLIRHKCVGPRRISTSRRDSCEMADGDAAGAMTIHTGEGVVRRTAFHDRIRAERDNLELEGTALQPDR